ncbi:flagellar basal body L-ring protein FlgH [Acidovorax sp. SUPP950]|uniref:flagellar basal body L-ring protein FlgH n=1 Tax=Acidovorax sp. SUPP950 TaxID=511901 RepID=UPI0023D7231F|nr:flagellar basal body L-ring protein FlgH [Acidovorax sp. SUPP950]GKS74673.1 flagellar basal body L-ring protein FlgH [Acidovorax sp. SUPP950]
MKQSFVMAAGKGLFVLSSMALYIHAAPACAESLYQEQSFRPLTADNKAFRVGDVLTVQVFENSSATTSADTGTRRKNGLSAELGHRSGSVAQTGIAVTGDFDGGGKTQRTNRVLATLTVSVREVLPNGELKVSGEQLLTVNDEPQKVTLEGRVRPLDISDGNVVLSTRLADARISYVGEGDIAERNRRPWWRALLDGMGL